MKLSLGTMSSIARFDGLMIHRRPKGDPEQLVLRAIEVGITAIDTAPIYGLGLAEILIGDLLVNKDAIISTKVGVDIDCGPLPIVNYAVDAMKLQLINSLRRLQRGAVEEVFVHNPWHEILTTINVDDFAYWAKVNGLAQSVGISVVSINDIPKNMRPKHIDRIMVEMDDCLANQLTYSQIRRVFQSIIVRSVFRGGKDLKDVRDSETDRNRRILSRFNMVGEILAPECIIVAPSNLQQLLEISSAATALGWGSRSKCR